MSVGRGGMMGSTLGGQLRLSRGGWASGVATVEHGDQLVGSRYGI